MAWNPASAQMPLADDKTAILRQLVDGLDTATLHWLAGYMSGLAAQPATISDGPIPASARLNRPQPRLTVIYGSQTGNARRVARQLGDSVSAAGLSVRVLAADDYDTQEFRSERLMYFVISTQGEGDAPDHARGLYDYLLSKRAPRLDHLQYAVLGLGDSSYAHFCQVGADLDARLEDLGARRVIARGDADVDYETVTAPWLDRALSTAGELFKESGSLASVTPLRPPRAAASWTRSLPFHAEVMLNQRVTTGHAGKDVRHIELSLGDSGLIYEPGDALGVWPQNPPELVDSIIRLLNLDADETVTCDDNAMSLREWLSRKRELTRLSRPVVSEHALRTRDSELDAILKNPDQFTRLLADSQLIDLLAAYSARWTAPELVAALRPLAPRLYSIASSMKAVGGEAHLTVARVAYRAFGRSHLGAASHGLCETQPGGTIPVYIEPNERFRLPLDASRDIVMIGPGTGVAPFRGFIQERSAVAASGRNWLFFGNPHLRHDFLYQLEWRQALKRGQLHRLDVAFSRDQSEKVYVQHSIRNRARDLYAWLRDGAHVYVCGDAKRMAPDVHGALRDVIIEQSGRNPDQAEEFLAQLAAEHRYVRDVY